jgi:hypothetical protein
MTGPLQLPATAETALRRSISNYSNSLGADFTQQLFDKLQGGIQSILNPVEKSGEPTQGETRTTVRADAIRSIIEEFDKPEEIIAKLNLDFKIQTATDVARGGGRYVADNFDQDELDAFPALELLRVYDRDVPRGFRRGKGGLIPVPDDDWPSRWQAAGGQLYDGRMIALKNDAVWENLGAGAGGYDDTLGNPFPPFAFNSGFDVDGVDRKECIELGLIDPDEKVKPVKIDFAKLFSLPK